MISSHLMANGLKVGQLAYALPPRVTQETNGQCLSQPDDLILGSVLRAVSDRLDLSLSATAMNQDLVNISRFEQTPSRLPWGSRNSFCLHGYLKVLILPL